MNEVVFRLFDQVFNLGDLEDLPELLSLDCQNSTSFVSTLLPGAAGFVPFVALLRDVFSSLFVELGEQTITHDFKSAAPTSPDEIVSSSICLHGVHRGEIFGIEPTGGTIVLSGEHRARVRDGQIVEQHLELSVPALIEQLGVPSSRSGYGQQ